MGYGSVNVGGAGVGGGKTIQQLELVPSGVYDSTGGAWKERGVPMAKGGANVPCVVGNKMYTLTSNSAVNSFLSERNLENHTVVDYPISWISGISFYSVFVYNDELYTIGTQSVSPNQHFRIHKINKALGTMSAIYNSNVIVNKTLCPYYLVRQINKTSFVFSGYVINVSGGAYIEKILKYDFATNVITELVSSSYSSTNINSIFQTLPDGNCLIGINCLSANVLSVYKIFASNGTIAKHGDITFPSAIAALCTVQLGDKLIYASNVLQGGKYTGELDLNKLTIDTTKYPNSIRGIGGCSLQRYQDNLIVYENSTMQYLPLVQNPPEENALVLKIFAGQKYNSLHYDTPVTALSTQKAFTITRTQQTAETDLEVHLGQYELDVKDTIIIESGE